MISHYDDNGCTEIDNDNCVENEVVESSEDHDLSVIVNALNDDLGNNLLSDISIPYNSHLYLDAVMRNMEEKNDNHEIS